MAAPKHFLTQEWYDNLIAELATLKETKLPTTLERLKEAIAQWDISENAEYDTAMAEKDLIISRITQIEEIMLDVEIIEHQDDGVVRNGSIVSFIDNKDRKHKIKIVWTWEVDVMKDQISLESPLGMWLKGKSKGMTAIVKAPNRKYQVEILEVE